MRSCGRNFIVGKGISVATVVRILLKAAVVMATQEIPTAACVSLPDDRSPHDDSSFSSFLRPPPCALASAPTPSSDSDRLCAAEVDACAADSTCLACILESNDNYDGCLPDAGYDVFTAPCSDVKDVVCCQMGDLLSCRSNALLGAFWGALWVLSGQHDRLIDTCFVGFSGGKPCPL